MKSISKVLVLSSVILGLCTFASAQDKGRAIVKYDKKKDQTLVRLKPFRISRIIQQKESNNSTPLHQTDLEVSYFFAGEKATKPVENVTFRFQVTSSNYTFLRPQAVIAVLDNDAGTGRAFALGTAEYRSFPTKFNSIFEEELTVDAPADALLRMAKAKTLQLYLGPVAYVISENQLNDLRELAGKMPQVDPTAK